jgi:oligopeptide transport system permease protein
MVINTFILISILYIVLSIAMALIWTRLPFSAIAQNVMRSYLAYIEGVIFHLDFQQSSQGLDVFSLVLPKFLISIKYNIAALVFSVIVGFGLGVLSAIRKNKRTDIGLQTTMMIFQSIPPFIVAFFLVIYVGYQWKLLIPQEPYYSAPFLKQLEGMIIPVVALSLWPIGRFFQMIRGELVEGVNSEHFAFLRAKGLTGKQIITRHGFRESLTTVIPEIIPTFVIVIGMSFLVESVYNIQGISNLFLDSIVVVGELYSMVIIDVNVVVAIALMLFLAIMFASLICDLLLTIIDPRIKVYGKVTTDR